MVAETDFTVEVEESLTGKYSQKMRSGRHELFADEPENVGGNDAGPNPYAYLLMGLGACTSMTLRMYAELKQLPLQRVRVRLSHRKVHAKDCSDCETREGKIDEITREITLEGELTDEQRQKLLEIANRCPVHRTLTSEIKVRTRLV
ncbi:MAG: OsmC-like protein [Gammaproteobacteria bacterium]|nr:OsmC-like protein [Gammaproteobacteria bacterium]